MRRASGMLAVLAACAAVAACGSSGAGGRAPNASLAESLAAQRDFRTIHRRWVAARPSARGALERELVAFLRQYPDDERARVARVYLAWFRVQQGRLAEARELVRQTREGPRGTAHDFAAVVEAAIAVREGRPDRALALLEPLVGKIVDPTERFLFGEQRVTAALGARKSREAVRAMRDWLAHAPTEDRDGVQGRILELVTIVPAESLEPALAELDAESKAVTAGNPELAYARDFVRKVARERLVRHAVERRDGDLARRLLDSGASRGEQGAELARVAASGAVLPRVVGRSVGLVLETGSPEARRRSAQVAIGMSRALGLPESARDPQAVQLMMSDDGGEPKGLERALAELAGEGAAILVAGASPDSATRAARYSEDASIPVIVLSQIPVAKEGFAFALGEASATEAAVLEAEARARGSTKVARVGEGGVSCDMAPLMAGMPRFPVQQWKRDGVDALLVLGDATCARDALREMSSVVRHSWLLLGFESAELYESLDPAQPAVVASAGAFPSGEGKTPPASMRQFAKTGGSPTWYAALGHDAAALARAALRAFPLERADDARVVAELHAQARTRLASARAELWSSERSGFDGGRALARSVSASSSKRAAPTGAAP